jgi:sugar phosphate isomerase/epimerase
MKLGFVSAILPELELADVLAFANAAGFATVEAMAWPVGKADRRYAGVTHVDASGLGAAEAEQILALCRQNSVELSALGYYPNPLVADAAESDVIIEHLKRVIDASARLGINQVNTFVGRDPARSLTENWKLFDARWPAIIRHAEARNVRVGVENCPMLFTHDEWPGGKNLAVSPQIWREMFHRIPSRWFGLNYDPSHLVWQQMDPYAPLREFAPRIFHVHAKDVRVDRHRLNEVGILATPLEYHCPKLPGLGEIDWGRFFSLLGDAGYSGPVCVEVEDRAYEGSLAIRQAALRQSGRFLQNFL